MRMKNRAFGFRKPCFMYAFIFLSKGNEVGLLRDQEEGSEVARLAATEGLFFSPARRNGGRAFH